MPTVGRGLLFIGLNLSIFTPILFYDVQSSSLSKETKEKIWRTFYRGMSREVPRTEGGGRDPDEKEFVERWLGEGRGGEGRGGEGRDDPDYGRGGG